MKLLKKTTIALLGAITAFPVVGMDLRKKPTASVSEHEQKKSIEHMNLPELAQHLEDVSTEEEVHETISIMIHLLTSIEDYVQAKLAAHRSGEQTAYAKRAYEKGYDYQRLYQYQEGYNRHTLISPHQALGQHENSPLNTAIVPSEKELAQIHALMSLIEQVSEMKLAVLNKTRANGELANAQLKAAMYQLKEEARKFEATFGKGSKFGSEVLPEPDFFNTMDAKDMNLCPDHLIIGKKVTTLFPNFSMEAWKH